MFQPYHLTHFNFGNPVRPSQALIVRDPTIHKLDPKLIKNLFMDATFKITPKPFSQVFSVLCEIETVTFTLATAFMTRRTLNSYVKVLEAIKEEFPEIQPENIMSDYELAIKLASQKIWPNAQHRGCVFHYMQAFFRKIKGTNILAEIHI